MPGRRPRTLMALLLFFIWMDARALGWMIFPATSASHHYYSALGHPWAHYVIQALTVAFAATAIGYLWTPRDGWLQASLAALAAFTVLTVGGSWHMLGHLGAARDAYRASREERGLPIPEERLTAMFTTTATIYTTLGAVAFFGFLAWLAWRRRAYVAGDSAEPADDS